mmetsp:Transcript_7530/g.13706  ORF Transcript_7530/g.13706 Transcript_7530/m.13706 type:complete len:154 (+) Transcript_7530:99-560(+)
MTRSVANVAAEPDNNDASPDHGRTAVELVEARQRRRKPSFLSMFSCRGRSSISNSVHFHAQHVEDSVHVIIKHDKEQCQKKGQPVHNYSPRAPLSERLESARKLEVARKASNSHVTIEAKEEDGESELDDEILAAVTMADCVSGSNAAVAAGP